MSHVIRRLRGLVEFLSRRQRRAVQLAFDISSIIFCTWLAFQLRLGFGSALTQAQIVAGLLAPVIAIPIYTRFGLYRAVLRYLPDMALWTIVKAVTLTALAWVSVLFFLGFYGAEGVPRSIPIIFVVLVFSVTLVSRFAAKQMLYWERPRDRRRYAIYGAGAAGLQYAQALSGSDDAELCAIIDDDTKLSGNEYHGVRVFAPVDLEGLVKRLGIETIVICMPSVSGQRRLEIAASLTKLEVKVQTLPSLAAIMGGKYRVEPFEHLDLNELLGRSPVPPDLHLIETATAGKTIVVTGAGGSIGSQLVDTLARNGAGTIIMVDQSEFALFEIDRKMRAKQSLCIFIPVLASVCDAKAMQDLFQVHRPQAVYHAAAYKHVGLAERNVRSAFENNVLGTKTLLEASANRSMQTFVLVSTDKAVNPTSVMGATKRFAELLVRNYADASDQDVRYLSVRFGNVIGSTGSVIPIFSDQIRQGGPVTVRGRGTNRYFMAVSEACELIIQAAGLAEGGETFMLKMGEPVSIHALARSMIELSGLSVKDELNPDGDIEISITEMEPGEKTTEELLYDPTASEPTKHSKIVRVKKMTRAHLTVGDAIKAVQEGVATQSNNQIRTAIFDALTRCQQDVIASAEANVVPFALKHPRK